MFFIQGNLLSAESFLRKELVEASSYSYWHNDIVSIYAKLVEESEREDLVPRLQKKFDTIFNDVEIVRAGERHLKAIENLKQWDNLLN